MIVDKFQLPNLEQPLAELEVLAFTDAVPVYAAQCNALAEAISVAETSRGVTVKTLDNLNTKANFGWGTIGHQAVQGLLCNSNRLRNRAKKERRRLKGKK